MKLTPYRPTARGKQMVACSATACPSTSSRAGLCLLVRSYPRDGNNSCRQAFGVTLHLNDCAQQLVDALYYMFDQRRVNALQELRIDGCPALSSSAPKTPDKDCLLPPPHSATPSLMIYILVSVLSALIMRAVETLLVRAYRRHRRRRAQLPPLAEEEEA